MALMQSPTAPSARLAPSALSAKVARNVKRWRARRGYSAARLAELAGVDPGTIAGVESGRGEPTLELAWKIAKALQVPFASLTAEHAPRGTVIVKKSQAQLFVSEDRGLTSRALFPYEEDRRVEFYELRLAPRHIETAQPHAPGTSEMLFVAEGALEIIIGREPAHRVQKGDTILFPADLAHSYRNLTDQPATLYLVMTYAEPPGLPIPGGKGPVGKG